MKLGTSLIALLVCLGSPLVKAQGGLVDVNSPLQTFIEKQQTLGLLDNSFLSHKPLSRLIVDRILDSLASKKHLLSPQDQTILEQYLEPKTLLASKKITKRRPALYPYKESFMEVRVKDLRLQVNPVMLYTLGNESRTGYNNKGNRIVWQQSRGIRITGDISKKFYFDTQYEGTLYKPYEGNLSVDPLSTLPRYRGVERTWDAAVDRATYDIPTATGVLGYVGKYVDLRLGRTRNRWSEGIGSIYLSDYAPEYDHVRFSTTIWKLEYVAMVAAFNHRFRMNDVLHTRRKYGTFHSLSFNISERLNLTAFESIIFSRDSLGMNKTQIDRPLLDPAFLNPMILFQPLEEDLGDLGNATIGIGGYWRPYDGIKLYGQFLLDEFAIRDYLSNKNPWTKKYALLAGLHVALVPKSNIRIEASHVRPYTYSHHSGQTNYIHFNSYLGHHLGANFQDIMLIYNLVLPKNFNFSFVGALTKRGRNDTDNTGGDPLVDYTSRYTDENVEMFSGVRLSEQWVETRLSKEILPKLFITLQVMMVQKQDTLLGKALQLTPMLQIEWNRMYQNARF